MGWMIPLTRTESNKKVMYMIENSQSFAVWIEHIMCDAFECERGEIGLVHSDYIRSHPFLAVMCTLTFLCKQDETDDIRIVSDFFNKFRKYDKFSIDELLSSEGNTGEINGLEYESEYTDGEEVLQAMITEFRKACADLKK